MLFVAQARSSSLNISFEKHYTYIYIYIHIHVHHFRGFRIVKLQTISVAALHTMRARWSAVARAATRATLFLGGAVHLGSPSGRGLTATRLLATPGFHGGKHSCHCKHLCSLEGGPLAFCPKPLSLRQIYLLLRDSHEFRS